MKSEPNVYSIADLERDGVTCWEGVRNYQARNMMRDEMKKGDEVLAVNGLDPAHLIFQPLAEGVFARLPRGLRPGETTLDGLMRLFGAFFRLIKIYVFEYDQIVVQTNDQV